MSNCGPGDNSSKKKGFRDSSLPRPLVHGLTKLRYIVPCYNEEEQKKEDDEFDDEDDEEEDQCLTQQTNNTDFQGGCNCDKTPDFSNPTAIQNYTDALMKGGFSTNAMQMQPMQPTAGGLQQQRGGQMNQNCGASSIKDKCLQKILGNQAPSNFGQPMSQPPVNYSQNGFCSEPNNNQGFFENNMNQQESYPSHPASCPCKAQSPNKGVQYTSNNMNTEGLQDQQDYCPPQFMNDNFLPGTEEGAGQSSNCCDGSYKSQNNKPNSDRTNNAINKRNQQNKKYSDWSESFEDEEEKEAHVSFTRSEPITTSSFLKYSQAQNLKNKRLLLDSMNKLEEEGQDIPPEIFAKIVEIQCKKISMTPSKIYDSLFADELSDDLCVKVGAVPGSHKDTVPLSSGSIKKKNSFKNSQDAAMLDSAYAVQIPRKF